MTRRVDHARNAAIWRAYASGRRQDDIGEEFGLSQPQVSAIIKKMRESIPQETRAEQALREVAFLDHVRAEAMQVAALPGAPVTAGKDGDIVRDPSTKTDEDPEGKIVRDYAGRLAAMSLAVQTSRDLRKLLGLDAPTKTEISGGVRHELVGIDPEDLT